MHEFVVVDIVAIICNIQTQSLCICFGKLKRIFGIYFY